MVEDWLENIYGKTTALVKVPSVGLAATRDMVHSSDKLLETSRIQDCSPSEGRVLASRPPTITETSAPCDVNTPFIKRKGYKWRKWATESV